VAEFSSFVGALGSLVFMGRLSWVGILLLPPPNVAISFLKPDFIKSGYPSRFFEVDLFPPPKTSFLR
jgi:hypothetical protein